MFQLLRGLRSALREGVSHGFLDPSKVQLSRDCDVSITGYCTAEEPEDSGDDRGGRKDRDKWHYRSPELLMGRRLFADWGIADRAACDLWSAGCIFAEMIGRSPLFAAGDFMGVVKMVGSGPRGKCVLSSSPIPPPCLRFQQIDVLGSRPDEELTCFPEPQAVAFLRSLHHKQRERVPWTTLFPAASPQALRLLDRLLKWSPAQRATVDETLDDPFFESVRGMYDDAASAARYVPARYHDADAAENTLVTASGEGSLPVESLRPMEAHCVSFFSPHARPDQTIAASSSKSRWICVQPPQGGAVYSHCPAPSLTLIGIQSLPIR